MTSEGKKTTKRVRGVRKDGRSEEKLEVSDWVTVEKILRRELRERIKSQLQTNLEKYLGPYNILSSSKRTNIRRELILVDLLLLHRNRGHGTTDGDIWTLLLNNLFIYNTTLVFSFFLLTFVPSR